MADASSLLAYRPRPQQDPYARQAQDIIAGGQKAGFFNPMGSPDIMTQIRAQGVRSLGDQLHSSNVLSRLLGLDPYQQRQALVDTHRQALGGLSSQLGGAHLQQLLGNQDFVRNLLTGRLGAEDQQRLLQLQQAFAKSQQPGFGDFFAQILGQLAGGAGTALGAKYL